MLDELNEGICEREKPYTTKYKQGQFEVRSTHNFEYSMKRRSTRTCQSNTQHVTHGKETNQFGHLTLCIKCATYKYGLCDLI